MNRTAFRSFATFVLAVALAQTSNGSITSYARLGNLLQRADAVIAANVQYIVLSGNSLNIQLAVTRTIKGDATVQNLATVVWPTSRADFGIRGGVSIKKGDTGIWFLKRQTAATWAVLPVMNGNIPIREGFIEIPPGDLAAEYSYDVNTPPDEKLVNEILAAANNKRTAGIATDLMTLGPMDDLDADRLNPIWTRMASSPTPGTRAIGLSRLIRMGDSKTLNLLANGDAALIDPRSEKYLASAILHYHNSGPSGVAALGRLSQIRYADQVRSAAAYALRAIHTREALPFLSALLDSSSPELRYEAVAGIASFANNLPVLTIGNVPSMEYLQPLPNARFATDETRKNFPAYDYFRRQEATYISFWKKWLSDHQAALSQQHATAP